MNLFAKVLVLGGVLLDAGVTAQTDVVITDSYFGTLTCIGPQTALPNCNSFNNELTSCASQTGKTAKLDCLCQQDFFNAIFDCESELRICFQGTDADNTLDEAVVSWHQVCDGYVTYEPTTPIVSTVSNEVNDYCVSTASPACASARDMNDRCFTVTDLTSMSSCQCNPDLIRLQYTCEFLGNSSCLLTGATLSDLAASTLCDNFDQVIGTSLTSASGRTVTLPTVTTASPGNTGASASVPTATTTTTTSAAGIHLKGCDIITVSFLAAIAWSLSW